MRYGTVTRRWFKTRWGLRTGLVEDHHIIPKEWSNHPVVLRNKYDVNNNQNLIMMPTHYGMEKLNIREDRMIHHGGHNEYNKFVKSMLDSMLELDESEKEFKELCLFLRKNCRDNQDNIPWRRDARVGPRGKT